MKLTVNLSANIFNFDKIEKMMKCLKIGYKFIHHQIKSNITTFQ